MIQVIKPLKTDSYEMLTQVYFGRGALYKLPIFLSEDRSKKTLVVVGSHFKNNSFITQLLKIPQTELYNFEIRKADCESINKLTSFCRSNDIKRVVAIGGGSILDTAKCAAILAIHKGAIEDYLITKEREIKKNGLEFIAIPTTAGTGSEVTPWATVWGDDKKKYSLSSEKYMYPTIAIVDSSLTDTVPATVSAESGIDALVQAVEAYWNIKHNPTSDTYALESIKTILESLRNAVINPSNTLRDKMMWGSLTSGLAFSNTQTTICHAVSYPITAHWGIAHGQATSITLPLFIIYTFPSLSDKRRKELQKAFGAKTDEGAAEVVKKLMQSIGLKTKLSEFGIPKEGIEIIVSEGFDPARVRNAPRIPSPQELKNMLLTIY